MSKLDKPVIVACPPFDDQSGGCIVLHYLVHRLRSMGIKAYVFPIETLSEMSLLRRLGRALTIRREHSSGRSPFRTHPALDTPLAPLWALWRGIVVYPEIVSGNPLGCAHVARWILYTPRGFGVGEDFAKPIPGEEVFFFQLPFIEHIDWIPRENALRLQWHRDDIFNDPGPVERTEICRMIRKGAATADSPPPGAEGATLLDGKSNEEIAEVFKRARLFYCHDPYTMYCDYAALCGCLPIVVPPPGLSPTDWRLEADRLGIAYGDSPEQLEWAARTRSGLFDRIKELKRQEDGMLEHLVGRLTSTFGLRRAWKT
ncbi:hypothetical protein [Rhodopseudomonas palustris]|uniref:hypothetical protein n=1 Tax=Rhodopseudomonas palustris TaxID=1076 RepID=UPI0021F253F4|nr:hypothetical protein [Rhodopseudomonas palustris]UYO53625.1 hypothetical protein KQX61_24105 [Rhodopseudomonas palustris]